MTLSQGPSSFILCGIHSQRLSGPPQGHSVCGLSPIPTALATGVPYRACRVDVWWVNEGSLSRRLSVFLFDPLLLLTWPLG